MEMSGTAITQEISPCPICGRQPKLRDEWVYQWGCDSPSYSKLWYECRPWLGMVTHVVSRGIGAVKGRRSAVMHYVVMSWNDAVEAGR